MKLYERGALLDGMFLKTESIYLFIGKFKRLGYISLTYIFRDLSI